MALVRSAYPIVDEKKYYHRLEREYFEYYIWRDKAFKYISQLKPDVVIMSSGYEDFSAGQWIEGASRILKQIENDVVNIYIIAPTPELPVDAIECLTRQAWINKFFILN